jgi:hypothetical protein
MDGARQQLRPVCMLRFRWKFSAALNFCPYADPTLTKKEGGPTKCFLLDMEAVLRDLSRRPHQRRHKL